MGNPRKIWNTIEKGVGVFNGDTGIIKTIKNLQKQQKLSLKMADGRNIHLNGWMNWNLLMQ